jgi:hypothetical protein
MTSTPLYAFVVRWLPDIAIVAAVISGALWTGVLFSVSWLSGRARWMADGVEVGSLALTLSRRWGTPLLTLCMASALVWVGVQQDATLQQGGAWLLGLGGMVLVLLLLHATVDHRAMRVSRGSVRATQGEGMRRLALIMSLAALAALVGFQWPR